VSRRRTAAALLSPLVTLLMAAPAAADDISSGELEPLLSSAADDPAAGARLARVTSIDGRPADLDRVLSAGPDERAARLAELERVLEAGDPGADGAELSQRAAELSVEGEREQPAPDPPTEGGSDGSPFTAIGVSTPVAIGLALLVLLIAGVLAQRAGRRRLPPGSERATRPDVAGEGGSGDSPSSLERRADRAARDGDHATAVRLRFNAGLQRLARADAIELRPSLTPGQVARSLPSQRLRALTSTFERVVYGKVPATQQDSSAARRDWPVAIREAGGK